MTRKRTPFLSPFLMWSDLAVKTGEMMMASAAVISHRTGRMATASFPPTPADQQDFTLMGQEKGEAMRDSAFATGHLMLQMGPEVMMQNMQHMLALSADMLSLAASTSPAQAFSRQAKFGRTLLSPKTADLSDVMARLTDTAMTPLHKRATANAKRLQTTRR